MSARTAAEFPQARQALRAGLPWFARVGSSSMRPLLWPGATVELQPCSTDELRIGDVICVDRGCDLLVHRLIARHGSGDEAWFITRGDRCPRSDPLSAAADVVGRVSAVDLGPLTVRIDRRPGRALGWIAGRLWPLLAPALAIRRGVRMTFGRGRVADGA